MSGHDLPSEYALWVNQPYLQITVSDALTAFDDGIGGERAGELMAWLGVWPGDSRNRWIWPHGDYYDPMLGWVVSYDDWAVGDHQLIAFGAFQLYYIGQIIGGAHLGVFVPYL